MIKFLGGTKEMKKRIIAVMMGLTMMVSGMTAYAAEQSQGGYSWVQEGEIWRLKDVAGNNMSNTWYQDGTGARYYLDASGVMKTGLVDLAGCSYYLGTDGKMVVTNA